MISVLSRTLIVNTSSLTSCLGWCIFKCMLFFFALVEHKPMCYSCASPPRKVTPSRVQLSEPRLLFTQVFPYSVSSQCRTSMRHMAEEGWNRYMYVFMP